jgi:hypothetical protein
VNAEVALRCCDDLGPDSPWIAERDGEPRARHHVMARVRAPARWEAE